ncbi:heterokaryon incompatibility protein-domain-containing protein [Xylaria telfairii]|nr:heterokaryon incompatibility protein-domain-containing protein [Xylaria telfairii]
MATNSRQEMASTPLCDFCEELIGRLFNPQSYPYSLMMRTSLYDTATNCALCRLITRADSTHHVFRRLKFPVFITVGYLRSYAPGQSAPPVTKLKLSIDDKHPMEFSIWVDEGNQTPRDLGISTERPIFTNNPYEAVPLISKWLRECLLSHDDCLKTVCGQPISQGEYVTLPTRALCVTNLGHIKLLESRGLKDRYCALSHCWGSPDNQPLRTVKENLKTHLAGIPFSKLPKTFQEACIITRGLGVDYLWIDSLCIVQDDPDDWFHEAQIMGSIYEKATLMISASGSSDSNGGCFVVERSEDTPTASIFVKTNDEHIIRLNLRLIPQATNDPAHGPLASRGWALQERYLARRMVFFMPGGISWHCHNTTLDEQSSRAYFELFEHLSWC